MVRQLSEKQLKQGLLYCLFAILALAALLHYVALPKLIDKRFEEKAPVPGFSTTNSILLPDLEPHRAPFIYNFQLDYAPHQQTVFRLFTVGCIERMTLNGKEVPFDEKAQCRTMDLDMKINFAPQVIDFAPFLQPGSNTLSIKTCTAGLQIGPEVFTPGAWRLSDVIGLGLIVISCTGFLLLMRLLTGEWGGGGMMLVGLLLCIHYLCQNSIMQHADNPVAHLKYVSFIATHGYWPGVHADWEYYQAPLYYSLQALLLVFVNWLGSVDTVAAMRVFSLSCFTGFLIFSALILRRLLPGRLAYYTALLMLACYPSGILLSVRVNNEVLFYALYSGCLYFALRWLEEAKARHLALALVMLGLGLATRTNTIILLPTLGLIAWHQLRHKGWAIFPLRSAALWAGVAMVALGAGMNAGRMAYQHFAHYDGHWPLIAPNTKLFNKDFDIGNSPDKYLLMDVRDYLQVPFWDLWHDKGGRQYFWNSLLKSSLVDRFIWAQPWLALVLGDLLLALILCVGVSIVCDWRHFVRQREWQLLMLTLAVPLLAMMIFRGLYPFSTSENFRYIYPAIVSFCGLCGMVIGRHRERKRAITAAAVLTLCLAFSGGAAGFYLLQD